jgi:hypothetical protein
MKISQKSWKAYTDTIAKVSGKASDDMVRFARKNGLNDRKKLIDHAMALTQKYGEGATTAAQNMYDSIAHAQGADVDEAEPADLPEYGEVAKSVNGTLKQSPEGKLIGDSVYRLVKRAGSDTMLKNAKRDHAEFAWINSGDACTFCQVLASNGWQRASKKTIQGDHADHIHANCRCEFAIRFSPDLDVAGYDPESLRKEWDEAEGFSSNEKLNYLRRKHDHQEKEDKKDKEQE